MSTKVDRRYAKDHQREKFSWKIFLKPGWIMAMLAIIAFSYATFSFLAPWQLGKDDDIVQRNEQIEASFDSDPVPYQQVLDGQGAVTGGEEWSRVSLTGQYLPDKEVLLRLRPVESLPVYQGLTPFETNAGDVVLIQRGFVEKPDTSMPDIEPAPSGEVTITGHARLNEAHPDNPPMTDQGRLQVYGINTDQIGEAVDEPLAESYVQLSAGAPGELTAMPIPQLERGSHLSYGFQWIAFGVMAPLGLGYFIWAEVRERRRVRREEAELNEPATSGPSGDARGAEGAGDPGDFVNGSDPEDHRPADVAMDTPVPEPVTAMSASAAPPQPAPAARSKDVRARYGGQHTDFWGQQKKRSRERF